MRARNAEWLREWDSTAPAGVLPPQTFGAMVRTMTSAARAGECLPFVMELEGRLVGAINVNNVVRGSAQFASVGYWIDQAVAGRGLTPRALAMVVDHCFGRVGLHRIEVSIRPENAASLRVVEKLGIREVGYAPRYLHINGAWRDHRIFAITIEECPGGLQRRLGPWESHA